MKTHIDIKKWKSIDKNTYKNEDTGKVIIEKKCKDHFEYFSNDDEYLGRFNSDISLFKDGLVLVVIDSEYR